MSKPSQWRRIQAGSSNVAQDPGGEVTTPRKASSELLGFRLGMMPTVTLVRINRYTGEVTRERLPEPLAEWVLAAIPFQEPEVARARLERE